MEGGLSGIGGNKGFGIHRRLGSWTILNIARVLLVVGLEIGCFKSLELIRLVSSRLIYH